MLSCRLAMLCFAGQEPRLLAVEARRATVGSRPGVPPEKKVNYVGNRHERLLLPSSHRQTLNSQFF